MECKSYNENEDVIENKEIFVYGLKLIKTDKTDTDYLFGCESEKLFKNDKLFILWSNKFINKEIEMRNFKITRWTLVKKKRRF